MERRGNFRSYLRAAFLNRWNLLLFLGGAVAAAMSPMPDALLALIAAGELTYLGGLISRPKFRDAIDAQTHKAVTGSSAQQQQSALSTLLQSLPRDVQARFERLLSRCRELRALATAAQGDAPTELSGQLRTGGLDQLLYGFLRLLVHHDALDRLLSKMDEPFLERSISQLTSQVASARESKDERLANSLQERLTTAQSRLEYAKKTRRDADFVIVELDRLEEKIQALSEQAVNQRDPDALSASIDAAAESMQRTQASLADLQNLSGLAVTVADAPAILDADLSPRVAPKLGGSERR